MRLIDADELMEYVWRCRLDSRERIADLVKSMPTIEQRKGKWIYPTDIKGFCRCENCKALWRMSFYENRFFRFCPRCGSDNRGKENE